MDEPVRMTCFGAKKAKPIAGEIIRVKDKKRRQKSVSSYNISPLSSINGDEAIKAHRMDLLEVEANPQEVDLLTDLENERVHRQNLEEQLAAALNVNAEMKLALMLKSEEGDSAFNQKLNKLKSQLKKERKEKEEADEQLVAAKREAAAMKAALNAAKAQRDDLEAELMEAALDVMDGEKQRDSLSKAMAKEKGLKREADAAKAETAELRIKLADSESKREALEAKLEAMVAESQRWEMTQDALQAKQETVTSDNPLVSAKSVDASAPTTPPQARKGVKKGRKGINVTETGIVEVAKPEPWRQVVLKKAFSSI